MNVKKALLWGGITVFLIWFFYDGIPVDIYSSWSTTLFLIAGVTTSISAVIFLLNILPNKEPEKIENNKIPEGDNSGYLIALVFVVFFIGFPIFLISHEIDMESNELKNYGEFSSGIIVDGSSITTRKADFSNLTVQYKTKEGKVFTEKCDISAQEFDRFYQNQEVPIVYSKRYPSFYKVLRNDEEIARFSKRRNVDLSVKDFISIIDMKTPNEILQLLNSINQKWDYQSGNDVNTTIFENQFKKIALKVTLGKEIVYLHNKPEPNLFTSQIESLGFKKSNELAKLGTIYTNGKYIISQRIETIKGNDIMDIRQLSVLDILKTN